MDLQHSPLNDHLLRIYLLKPCQGKIWQKKKKKKKKSMVKEKDYNILQVSYDCLIKTFQRKNLWEKTLAKEKEYNQYIIF
jgi:hypothetical protein